MNHFYLLCVHALINTVPPFFVSNFIYSCEFHGTATELGVHLEEHCPFEGVKDFLWRTESSISELQASLQQKDQEIGFLKSMLGKISERVEILEKNMDDKLGNLKATLLYICT